MDQTQIREAAADALGVAHFSPEKQDELIDKISELLLKRIFLATVEALDEGAQVEYNQLMEGDPTPEEVDSFLQGKIDDYEGVVRKVIDSFKEEMQQVGKQ